MSEASPVVTVIVGAYNAMPYLTRCLTSVMEQSLGSERIEIVAVDDGSTDSTGTELDRLAAEYAGAMTVLHQPNSGGPAAPRNAGLDRARGRHVFFLDADDYLGAEALERMVAAADDNRSDVVLGKMVGVGGRGAPTRMFRRNQARTNVFDSDVYWTLNPLKLFRRELLERLGLRFRTDLVIGEDQPFTAMAYLQADAISVVADYDCVFWVARDDGANITRSVRGTGIRLRFLTTIVELVREHTEPGEGRDHLLSRHIGVDLRRTLRHLAVDPDRAQQEKDFRAIRELLAFICGEGVLARLPAADRLRCHLIQRGELDALLDVLNEELDRGVSSLGRTPSSPKPLTRLMEGGRVYTRYPHFRAPRLALPDSLYDTTDELRVRQRLDILGAGQGLINISGLAYLAPLRAQAPGSRLILRERKGKREFSVGVEVTDVVEPGARGERVGFSVTLDPASMAGGERLPDGLWDAFLEVGAQGVTREVRFGSKRALEVTSSPATQLVSNGDDSVFPVTFYFTDKGNLTLDVGEKKHAVPPLFTVDEEKGETAGGGPKLVVRGRTSAAHLPAHVLKVRADRLDGDGTRQADAEWDGDGRFVAALPLQGMAGDWTVSLRLGTGAKSWTLPVPAGHRWEPVRWRRYGRPWFAKTLAGDGKRLTLRVAPVNVLAAARKQARP